MRVTDCCAALATLSQSFVPRGVQLWGSCWAPSPNVRISTEHSVLKAERSLVACSPVFGQNGLAAGATHVCAAKVFLSSLQDIRWAKRRLLAVADAILCAVTALWGSSLVPRQGMTTLDPIDAGGPKVDTTCCNVHIHDSCFLPL